MLIGDLVAAARAWADASRRKYARTRGSIERHNWVQWGCPDRSITSSWKRDVGLGERVEVDALAGAPHRAHQLLERREVASVRRGSALRNANVSSVIRIGTSTSVISSWDTPTTSVAR